MERFIDRANAGSVLARLIKDQFPLPDDLRIVGLVRGGVPIAASLARQLSRPMDILLIRKLGHPTQKELAIGAITDDGEYRLNEAWIKTDAITEAYLQQTIAEEMAEMQRRRQCYQLDHWQHNFHKRPIILVDDGIATGATMQAAVQFMQRQHASHISIAAPIIAQSAIMRLKPTISHLYYLHTLEPYHAIGAWYENFEQVTDQQLLDLLQQQGMIDTPS